MTTPSDIADLDQRIKALAAKHGLTEQDLAAVTATRVLLEGFRQLEQAAQAALKTMRDFNFTLRKHHVEP